MTPLVVGRGPDLQNTGCWHAAAGGGDLAGARVHICTFFEIQLSLPPPSPAAVKLSMVWRSYPAQGVLGNIHLNEYVCIKVLMSAKGYCHNRKKSVVWWCRLILLSILNINFHLLHRFAHMTNVLLQTFFRGCTNIYRQTYTVTLPLSSKPQNTSILLNTTTRT